MMKEKQSNPNFLSESKRSKLQICVSIKLKKKKTIFLFIQIIAIKIDQFFYVSVSLMERPCKR